MIDFLKIDISSLDRMYFILDPDLNFTEFKTNEDGEVFKEIAEFNEMKVTFYNTNSKGVATNRAYLEIRVHNLYNIIENGVSHNYNDFGFFELSKVISYVNKKFLIDIRDLKIENLEFGVNVPIDKPAMEYLKLNVLFHKVKSPSILEFNNKGYMHKYEHSDYLLKVYDKGEQYSNLTNKHILRFEIRTKRKRFFHPFGLERVCDLFNQNVSMALSKELLERFEELVIVDDLSNNDEIIEKDYTSLLEFITRPYWDKVFTDIKKKSRLKSKFNKLLLKWDLLNTKLYLQKALASKLLDLS